RAFAAWTRAQPLPLLVGCLTPSGVRHRAFAAWTRAQPLPLLVGCLTPSGVRHRAFAAWTWAQPLPLSVGVWPLQVSDTVLSPRGRGCSHCPCGWVSDTFRCQTPCIRGMDAGAATASVGGCLTPSGVRHRAFAAWTRAQPL